MTNHAASPHPSHARCPFTGSSSRPAGVTRGPTQNGGAPVDATNAGEVAGALAGAHAGGSHGGSHVGSRASSSAGSEGGHAASHGVGHDPAHSHAPQHGDRPSAVANDGLAALLRTSTAALHTLAEGQGFQQRLVAGRISKDEYAAFLHQVGHVHRALDAALDAAAVASADGRGKALIGALARPEHRRWPHIAADLKVLDGCDVMDGTAGLRPALPATQRFVDAIDRLAAHDPAALVGILYVVEGATNGNKVIAKALQTALGFAPGEAVGYLDPHGTEQRRRWMDFKAGLDTLPATGEERLRILDAARSTFQYFIDLSPELAGRTAHVPA